MVIRGAYLALESPSDELSSNLSLELRELYRRDGILWKMLSEKTFFANAPSGRISVEKVLFEQMFLPGIPSGWTFAEKVLYEQMFLPIIPSGWIFLGRDAFRAEVSSDHSFHVDRFREDGFGKGDVLLFRLSCVIQGNVLYAVEWLWSRRCEDWYFNRVCLRLSSSTGSAPLSWKFCVSTS